MSWSNAALVLIGVLFTTGGLACMIGRFLAGPDDNRLRGSHENQFANTSRRDYVSARGFR
jgi:hypothetical protein